LIQTAVERIVGGGRCTPRRERRRVARESQRPVRTARSLACDPRAEWWCSSLYQPKNSWQNARASSMQPRW